LTRRGVSWLNSASARQLPNWSEHDFVAAPAAHVASHDLSHTPVRALVVQEEGCIMTTLTITNADVA
jgi:hypothetical protein